MRSLFMVSKSIGEIYARFPTGAALYFFFVEFYSMPLGVKPSAGLVI